jgi:molecular chaperone DnaJ/curved DNA-binding protein
MTRKNYYSILGISSEDGPDRIHEAYRDLAKRHHPDRAGVEGTQRFQEVEEAYRTLSDPVRRAAHDRELSRDAPRRRRVEPEPLGDRPSRVPEPEPLRPDPMSVIRDFDVVRPSVGAVRARFLRNFFVEDGIKAEKPEGLNVEVVLSPEEAIRGGVVAIGVPVFERCPACDGTGRAGTTPCVDCRAKGLIEKEAVVGVAVPRPLRDGAIVELPLHGLGIHNFYLRVHFRLSG